MASRLCLGLARCAWPILTCCSFLDLTWSHFISLGFARHHVVLLVSLLCIICSYSIWLDLIGLTWSHWGSRGSTGSDLDHLSSLCLSCFFPGLLSLTWFHLVSPCTTWPICFLVDPLAWVETNCSRVTWMTGSSFDWFASWLNRQLADWLVDWWLGWLVSCQEGSPFDRDIWLNGRGQTSLDIWLCSCTCFNLFLYYGVLLLFALSSFWFHWLSIVLLFICFVLYFHGCRKQMHQSCSTMCANGCRSV